MPAATSIVDRAAPTVVGNHAYADRGFEPVALISHRAGTQALGGFASCVFDLGFGVVGGNGAISYKNINADPSPNGLDNLSTNAVQAEAAVLTNAADVIAVGPFGETLDWSASDTATHWASLAIGGQGAVAAVGSFDLPTAGTVTVSGLPFQPTFVMMAHHTTSAFGGRATSGEVGYGFSDGTNDRCVSNKTDSALTSNEDTIFRDDAVTAFLNFWHSPLDGFTADGFSLTPTVYPGATVKHVYLALAGVGAVVVGTESQRTSTGVKATATGNIPTLVLLIGGMTTAANTITADTELCFGTLTETAEAASWGGAQDAVSNAVTSSICKTDKSLIHGDYTGAIRAEADGVLTSSGFELDWTTADATARLFGYAALEVPIPLVSGGGAGPHWWWRRGY